MQKIKEYYHKLELLLGNMKFAVVIILLFSIALIYGTFMESYHGTDYAQRLVYKSWWFMAIQFAIFASVLSAALLRLPFKKRLYGFYTIHLGIIILFAGSFITFIVGIDGTLDMRPLTPSNVLEVGSKDVLHIRYADGKGQSMLYLPGSATPSEIDKTYRDVKVLRYLPFAKESTDWIKSDGPLGADHSSSYRIFNNNVTQNFSLALNPNSDFKSTMKLGLLNIHYMPSLLAECFERVAASGLLFWNPEDNTCFTPEEKSLEVKMTPKDTRFVVLPYKGDYLKFFPDFSPIALKDDLTKDESAPYRVFSLSLFQDKPHLFLFGKKLAIFNKRKSKWKVQDIDLSTPVTLPWMGFQLMLTDHRENEYPVKVPVYTKPIQDGGNIIEGDLKAIEVEIAGQKHWATNFSPLMLSNGVDRISIGITSDKIYLPYHLTLQRFVMKKNPGTNSPASYESFVDLTDSRGEAKAQTNHIFMNNPLKYDGLTFYQASYYEMAPEEYASVLSVNYDPGRPIKYFGSLLLVLGSIWHFQITRRRKKRETANA